MPETPSAPHTTKTSPLSARVAHNAVIRTLLQERERTIERVACRIRIAVVLLAAGTDTIIALTEHAPGAAMVMAAAGLAYAALMLWIHALVGRDPYRPWIKYFTTAVDFGLLAALTVYWTSGAVTLPIPAEETGMALIPFVAVANLLSGLRVGRPIVAYSTACALVSALAIGRVIGAHPLAIGYVLGITVISGLLALLVSTTTTQLFLRFAYRSELTRFLPKELVDRVDRGEMSLELGGTDREVTVLLSDIRGFTTLSESRPPMEVVTQLNEYFTAMSEVIFDHGGSIDKYIGDAILAVFGVPESRPDDARRAIAAAQAMLQRLDTLNADWTARGLPALHIGIGLHTGDAVAGNIGAPQRMEYTVIGDTVNVASRIEDLTKKYGTALLVSETTRGAAGDDLAVQLVDDAQIRGRVGTIKLYTPA